MRYEKKSTSQDRPVEIVEHTDVISNRPLTSLLTSNRNKFCSCSGLSRSRVKTRLVVCVRTYGRGSCNKFYVPVGRMHASWTHKGHSPPRSGAQRRNTSSTSLRSTTQANAGPLLASAVLVDRGNIWKVNTPFRSHSVGNIAQLTSISDLAHRLQPTNRRYTGGPSNFPPYHLFPYPAQPYSSNSPET